MRATKREKEREEEIKEAGKDQRRTNSSGRFLARSAPSAIQGRIYV